MIGLPVATGEADGETVGTGEPVPAFPRAGLLTGDGDTAGEAAGEAAGEVGTEVKVGTGEGSAAGEGEGVGLVKGLLGTVPTGQRPQVAAQ